MSMYHRGRWDPSHRASKSEEKGALVPAWRGEGWKGRERKGEKGEIEKEISIYVSRVYN
jgi:hypothetical protein